MRRQPLPGYRLSVERDRAGRELLVFVASDLSTGVCRQAVESLVLSGTPRLVLSGTGLSCYQEHEVAFSDAISTACGSLNLESNKESNDSAVRSPAAGYRRPQFREPRPSSANVETSLRAEYANLQSQLPEKASTPGALSSIDLRFFDCNLSRRSVHGLGTFRSEFTSPKPTHL